MFAARAIRAALLVLASACTLPGDPGAPLPAETFTGSWKSTTPSYEHLRLTVSQLPAIQPHLHARLTFSGVAWEGVARILSDSLVMDVTTSSQSGAAMVARPAPAGALSVRIQTDAAGSMTLTFVRGD